MAPAGRRADVGPMDTLSSALCGIGTGALLALAQRTPILAWLGLLPLGLAWALAGPLDLALAAALAGMIVHFPAVSSAPMRPLLPLNVGLGSVCWAVVFGGLSTLAPVHPAAALVALPLATVSIVLPPRLAGAPRWAANPLACSQEPWSAVVQVGRWGGDLVVSAMLGLAGGVLTVLTLAATGRVAPGSAIPPAVMGAVLVGGLLLLGAGRDRRARRRVASSERLRVAAVVADGPPPPEGESEGLWPLRSEDYRDVEGTITRYAPLVARAANEGARVVVLPEVGVYVDADGRERWVEAVQGWSRAHDVTIVAPFFHGAKPRNELVVVDPSGAVAEHEKQHPGPGIEPPRQRRLSPGPQAVCAGVPLSTVICVDLDYPDLVAPVRGAGGLLAVPANDWFGGFEELHHRTAIWAATRTGVTVVRATGHGISSVIDGAGRTLARCSSRGGPVVLVVDAPIAPPG